jgi:hypothetical protein
VSTARTNRTSAVTVSFTLLNEPEPAAARVLELLDAWFDRWLAT